MWKTDPGLVAAAAQVMSECSAGKNLVEYGLKLAKENISDHDRQLLGAMYKAKAKLLQQAGCWDQKAVESSQ